MKNLKTIFFGTPNLAVYVLEELEAAGIIPTLIVTTPDTPQGRKMELTPPPVKIWAEEHDIEVLQPEKLTDNPELNVLYNSEWDLSIVAMYGKLLPQSLIDLPEHGTLNVHPSLLPKFRGPSPIRSAILEDQRTTGVSIIKLDEEMDHGPIVAQARVELEEKDWPPHGIIFDEILARAGGELLAETIPAWVSGSIEAEPQDHDTATYSRKITRDMGEINLTDDAYPNLLKIRGLEGWPGTYFFADRGDAKIRVKIIDADVAQDNALTITRVIPEGKKEMAYEDFLRG